MGTFLNELRVSASIARSVETVKNHLRKVAKEGCFTINLPYLECHDAYEKDVMDYFKNEGLYVEKHEDEVKPTGLGSMLWEEGDPLVKKIWYEFKW